MAKSIFLLLVGALAANGLGISRPLFQGHLRSPLKPRPRFVTSLLPRDPPPPSWNWGDVNGMSYLTVSRNQHIPTYCGSCWAHAATSALSDRIKIMRNASWPDFVIAPQVLVSCGPDDGCHGGDTGNANEYMHKNGITDETCSIYRARGHDNGLACSKLQICETCEPGASTCTTPKQFYRYRVDQYADVEGNTPAEQEKNMMAEIYHRGPIACGIAVTEDLYHNYTGGVYYDKTNLTQIDHDISVVGYGHDAATGWDFWIIRNSWGTYWGEKGYFKLRRGVNNLGIESGTCTWATAENTWSHVGNPLKPNDVLESSRPQPPRPDAHMTPTVFKSKLMKLLFELMSKISSVEATRPKRTPCAIFGQGFTTGPRVLSPPPHTYIRDEDLPRNWDWRNVNGLNYLSWTVNQHVPQYCGSCWAQATVSALADRFIIADRKKYANLALSPQVVLNCRGGGSCEGGAPEEVYEFVHKVGIPDMTCEQYDATDHTPVANCAVPGMDVCRDCGWPPPKPGQMGNCWVRKNFTRYYTDEYGSINGISNMKKEIYARGPIGCGMDVTLKFEKYKGGIFSQHLDRAGLNHEISIVGWGFDEASQKEYWIGRNSWGTYWGEYGFFRIEMHKNNLGIGEQCVWATPKL